MSKTPFFNRFVESHEIEDSKQRLKMGDLLYREFLDSEITLSPEQSDYLSSNATKFLENNDYHSFELFSHISFLSSKEQATTACYSPIKELPHRLDRAINLYDNLFDVLKSSGIVDEDETALHHDVAIVRLGNQDAFRRGSVYLTDRRIVVIGNLITYPLHNKTVHRLQYDDWKDRPYLSTIDFLDYDSIRTIEPYWKFMKKEVVISYHTTYMKEKGTTLYGPLWLKWEKAPTVDIIEGLIDITFVIERLPQTTVKNFERKRQSKFVEKLRELSGL